MSGREEVIDEEGYVGAHESCNTVRNQVVMTEC